MLLTVISELKFLFPLLKGGGDNVMVDMRVSMHLAHFDQDYRRE